MNIIKKIVYFLLEKLRLFDLFRFFIGNKVYYLFSLIISNKPFFFLKENENCILIGVYNMHMVDEYSKFLKNTGTVNIFEISKKNIEDLKAQNLNKNVKFYNIGLSDKETIVSYQEGLDKKDQGYNKIISNDIRSKSMENRKANYIIKKSLCKDIFSIINNTQQKIKYISMTCNGAEIYVYKQIEKLKEKYPDLIIYSHVEYPYPFYEIVKILNEKKINYITSSLIRTIDKKTKLRRLTVFF